VSSPRTKATAYPFFTFYVKEAYRNFLDHVVTVAKSKCEDEFLATRIVFWDLQQFGRIP
jgi:hypothetical protein